MMRMEHRGELHMRIHTEDDAYWATVDEYPGVFATGDTLDELRESAAEGIALMLADADGPVPTVAIGEFQPVEQVATAELTCA